MKYPYYIVPDVRKYRQLDPSSEEAKRLTRRIAANVGDYAALRLVLGIDPPEFACFYPDMHTTTPSTLDTIDAFLDKFGSDTKPSGYYIPEEPQTLSSLLKEGRYKDALSFIESQNLINPQKSIYFAHQISFLKKLIAIEKFRKQPKG